jgi:hypothetical protein
VQGEAILEEQAFGVPCRHAAVEEVEEPGLAPRRPPDRPRIAQDGGGAGSQLEVDALDESRARRRNDVVGNVLESSARPDAHRHVLTRRRARAPVYTGGTGRGEADLAACAEIDSGLEAVAAQHAARGVQQEEGGGACPVQVHWFERLEGQGEASAGEDGAIPATLEGEAEKAVAPRAPEKWRLRIRRGARDGSSPPRGRRPSRRGDW